MRSKTYLLVVMVLLLAIGMGCGGGGGSSSGGGTSTNSVVGTWNLVSGTNTAQQIIINANGTGSYSGSPPSRTGSTSGTFTWTLTGNQITITQGSDSSVTTITWQDSNNFTLTGGATGTYRRA